MQSSTPINLKPQVNFESIGKINKFIVKKDYAERIISLPNGKSYKMTVHFGGIQDNEINTNYLNSFNDKIIDKMLTISTHMGLNEKRKGPEGNKSVVKSIKWTVGKDQKLNASKIFESDVVNKTVNYDYYQSQENIKKDELDKQNKNVVKAARFKELDDLYAESYKNLVLGNPKEKSPTEPKREVEDPKDTEINLEELKKSKKHPKNQTTIKKDVKETLEEPEKDKDLQKPVEKEPEDPLTKYLQESDEKLASQLKGNPVVSPATDAIKLEELKKEAIEDVVDIDLENIDPELKLSFEEVDFETELKDEAINLGKDYLDIINDASIRLSTDERECFQRLNYGLTAYGYYGDLKEEHMLATLSEEVSTVEDTFKEALDDNFKLGAFLNARKKDLQFKDLIEDTLIFIGNILRSQTKEDIA